MPRKSAASLSVVALTAIRPMPQRIAPPAHLSAAAVAVWHSVTASRPGEFFDAGSAPMLESYVVAITEHRRMVALLDTIDPVEDLDRLAKVTRLIESHAARIGACATRLRLTNQARYNPTRAGSLTAQGGTAADRVRAGYRGLSNEG